MVSSSVDSLVARSICTGDLELGGDGWSDKRMNSIYNIALFTTTPLYIGIGVWPEKRHKAENIAAFFAVRIYKVGSRNVFGTVTDTEAKMQKVWRLLAEDFPWIQFIPCTSHCLDILLSDLSKSPTMSRALGFAGDMTQYWRHHSLPKKIFERCQEVDKGLSLELQRPGASRWNSQVTAAECLFRTQSAVEKAVVDQEFKEKCLRSGDATQRKAAEKGSAADQRRP